MLRKESTHEVAIASQRQFIIRWILILKENYRIMKGFERKLQEKEIVGLSSADEG